MTLRFPLLVVGCLLSTLAFGAPTEAPVKSGEALPASSVPEKLASRDFRLPSDFFVVREKGSLWESAAQAAEARQDFREYLISRGVIFANGAKAVLNDKATTVTVLNTTAQLDLIDVILTSAKP